MTSEAEKSDRAIGQPGDRAPVKSVPYPVDKSIAAASVAPNASNGDASTPEAVLLGRRRSFLVPIVCLCAQNVRSCLKP